MYDEYYQSPNPSLKSNSQVDVKSSSFLSRVYGYMFIGIIITAIVAFGAGFGFQTWFSSDTSEAAYMTYLWTLIGSFIGLFIVSFIVNIVALRGRHSIAIPAVIYSVLMGIVFSEFVLFVPYWILGTAFVITSMVFAIMFFIARVTKRNLNWMGTLGFGLLMGALIMSIFFFFLYFVFPAYFSWLYVIIDGVIFVAMILITMFDVWRIQKIADKGAESKNLALYCAFSLYVDFMYILMRVIFILLRLFGSSRN
ncbi:MAG: Bax inhibitor-1 family protein [Bacilli bacterium]|jgi:FtsH-binding integral membrane protein